IGRAVNGSNSSPAPYLSCSETFNVEELAARFEGAKFLLVDDLDLLPDNADLRVGLWQIFNDFYSTGRKIAMAGLHHPRELPGLDDHLISRLLWGLVAQVDASDDHSR